MANLSSTSTRNKSTKQQSSRTKGQRLVERATKPQTRKRRKIRGRKR